MKKWLFGILSIVMLVAGAMFVAPEVVSYGEKENIASVPETKEEPNTEITEYTYKPFASYFTDFAIPTTLKESTITGKGSEDDPYIINSTEDFIFLHLFDVLWQKHLKLECDIVLNDESFDRDGNAIGGDGVVYSWEPIPYLRIAGIDGNNHTIKGAYFNDPTRISVGLFRYGFTYCRDLTIENLYFSGDYAIATITAEGVTNLKNVHTKNGYIVGNGRISGMCINSTELRNVTNGFEIIQRKGATNDYGVYGLVYGGSVKAYNCKNYGDIYTEKIQYTGGFFSYIASATIENCENYGDIYINSNYTGAGGIAGYTQNSIIKNCKNSGVQLVPLMLKFLGMYLREIIGCVLTDASIQLL